jgi:uncharacterized protein
MILSRAPFGYIVAIDGSQIVLNINDDHKGQVAAHPEGVVNVTSTGNLFGVNAGQNLLVLKVQMIKFAEPKEAHAFVNNQKKNIVEPLRNIIAQVLGILKRDNGNLKFISDSLVSPPLGAEAYPLSPQELNVILNMENVSGDSINLGESVRNSGKQYVNINNLLSRHVAVLGSTGQGKSCFTASILQQLVKFPKSKIVIFDINGEYADALNGHIDPSKLKTTILGGSNPSYKIPYYALGRHGLGRLLLPSEKTQRPALNFALENLQYLEWDNINDGAYVSGLNTSAVFYDDCRAGNATAASLAIDRLRSKNVPQSAINWAPMSSLSCLVADSYSVKPNRGTFERNAFDYGNVAPLINRIKRLIDDPMFTSVVNVDGSIGQSGGLDWKNEARNLVGDFFGKQAGDNWNVHLIDLREVAHDLLPFILGSLLESLAYELFRRGAGATHPTLLVLEEAHHYLRQLSNNDETGKQALAYERLAKEGRKFGISLWLSTQRPSELSSTVLSQCATWVVFKLASELDLKSVASATEWLDKNELKQITGLPRRNALLFGSCVSIPARIISPTANPLPRSHDPDFTRWN